MIALPFHPSNTYEIDELNANLGDILRTVEKEADHILGNPNVHLSLTDKIVDGKLLVQQGVIAGCAGGNYSNVMTAAHILSGKDCRLSVLTAGIHGSGKEGSRYRVDGCRRYHPYSILRTVLRRRRYSGEQHTEHPPYHEKLPEP